MTSLTASRAHHRAPRGRSVHEGSRSSSQGVRLCLGMLRGAFVAAQVGLVLSALGCHLLDGSVAAVNSLLASVLVVLFFASGQAVQMVAGEMADSTAMVLLMASYLLRVVLLGLGLVLAMNHQDQLEGWFNRPAFMAGALCALAGWLGGIFATSSRQHVYAYDRDHDDVHQDGGSR